MIRTKNELLNEVLKGKPVSIEDKDAKWLFAFQRMSGEEILLRKLMVSQATEESLQTLPRPQMRDNVEEWCRENGLKYYEDWQNRRWVFKK